VNLTFLANKFHSDKGTVSGDPPHRYTYLYDLIFYPFKETKFNLLEMGLAVGGPEVGGPVERRVGSPSLSMWLEYFPLASIYGFDISDFSHITHPRFKFIQGDSGSIEDLLRLSSSADTFDIIIDDASHASYHQQLAFKTLWGKLAKGGLFIIEDLQWQSPVFENILPKVPKTAELFFEFFENNSYLESDLLNIEFMKLVKLETQSFSAFHSFDGSIQPLKQIVIRKS
jgi:SAM-dependent methyltransferase